MRKAKRGNSLYFCGWKEEEEEEEEAHKQTDRDRGRQMPNDGRFSFCGREVGAQPTKHAQQTSDWAPMRKVSLLGTDWAY